jgi:DHA1 family bicyclomycin/chloramphenicol resistance-like MFS transporter
MEPDSRRFTAFLASIAALTSLSIDMSLPSVPAIEHDFGIAAGRGALTMSLFLAGYAATPLVGGPLADRFGRRPVLLVSLVLFVSSAIGCSISPTFSVLLACRLIQGCASGVATTMPIAIVRDMLSGSAARQRLSEVTTINSIMPIVAPLIGSLVMVAGRWRILFGCQAIFAGCIVAALLLDFRESLPKDRRHRLHPVALITNYWHLLTTRVFLGYALVNGLTFASVFSFISVSPLILMQRMGISRATYPLLFALIALGGITGSLTSALLSRRHTTGRTLITTGLSLLTAAAIVGAALQIAGFHRPIAILCAVFAALFGFGLMAPSVTIGALQPVPELAGSGSGALRSILMICGSGTSGFLALYCGRHFMRTELATTLTMSGTALAAFILYLSMLRTHDAT